VRGLDINLVQFYEVFIENFEGKLNQLTLVRIVIDISGTIPDINQRIAFIQSLSELPKVIEHKEASVYAKAVLAEFHISIGSPLSLIEARGILDKAKSTLDETVGTDAGVFSAYHRSSAAYFKVKGNYESFYSSALQYLGYTQLTSLDPAECVGLARDLVIAALLGEKLFTLGELMENEILQMLRNTNEAWLVDILTAFNFGDLNTWKVLQQKYADHIERSDLRHKGNVLTAKIKILSLIELVFNRPSGHRRLRFEEIAQNTDVPLNQVELLVMKALSLGLLRGNIDEVDQVVNFTWVQPRILNLKQVSGMRTRLQSWIENVKSALILIENEMTPELIY
jgi:26S proteasome regulatory subunit N9